MKTADTRGFTLIELIIVIAILAIISVIAIGKFADLRKEAARKANVANIRNIARTIDTEIARRDGENIKGLFAYAESLVDAAEGGGDATGAAGSYLVRASWYDGNGGFVASSARASSPTRAASARARSRRSPTRTRTTSGWSRWRRRRVRAVR